MKVQPKNQEDEIDKSYLLLLSSDVIQRLLTVFGFKLILQNNVSDIVPSFLLWKELQS